MSRETNYSGGLCNYHDMNPTAKSGCPECLREQIHEVMDRNLELNQMVSRAEASIGTQRKEIETLKAERDALALRVEQNSQSVEEMKAVIMGLTRRSNELETALREYAKEENWRCHRCERVGSDHTRDHDYDVWCGPEDGPEKARDALEEK